VSKIRRPVLFFLALILLPPVAFSLSGDGDFPGDFVRLLEERGIFFERGLLFASPGEGAAEQDFSLLIPFSGNAGAAAWEDDSAGPAPLMIAAFPLRGGGRPGEEGLNLPCRFRAALSLAEALWVREAAGQGLPGDLLIAFLGEADTRQYQESGGPPAGELSAYGGIIREPENTVFWFFNLEDDPHALVIHHGTAETIAPLESLKNMAGFLQALKIPYRFAVPFNELYKLGLAGGPPLLHFTQEQGIRALFFSGAPDPGAGAQGAITGEALGELILAYSASLESPGENQDYHYLIIPFRGRTVFLSQGHTALVLFLIAAVFFLGFLLYRIFRPIPPARILLFFRCFWTIPAFFFLLFVSLEAAGLAAAFFSGGETRIPLIYGWAAWKLLLGLGLFAAISIPLGGYRIPRRAVFYGRCALLLIVLDTFIAAWADICFIPFFIGAFLLIFLGARITHPILVYLCAVSAPFYGFTAGVFSILSGYGGLGTFLLSSGPAPTALMILAVLPFVLLFKRAMNLRRREKSPVLHRLLPFFILLGLALILGIILWIAR
jgi:hypothetical protein